MNSFGVRTLRIVAIAVAVIAMLSPQASAQSRQRLVKRWSSEAATLSGHVVESATGQPVERASIRVGPARTTTGADGTFSITELTANPYEVKASRWGYADYESNVSLNAGPNQIEIRLAATENVTVRETDGAVKTFAFDTTEFGYIAGFAGWSTTSWLRLCLPDGQESLIKTEEMATVTFEGTRTENTSCCSIAPGRVARVARKGAEAVSGTILQSCSGFDFYVRGRERSSGKMLAVNVAGITSITFE